MSELQGRTLGGRYKIVELIGRGGTADTFRAFDARLGRDVAVKAMVGAQNAVAQRLLLEAQAMASLNHPKIVSVFDAAEDDGLAYIVMELVRGRTLSVLEGGSLTYKQALTYVLDVLEALEYAHGQGILHRDVKPSNIMTSDDGAGAKLMDFGLARRSTDVTLTTSNGQIAGTIAYLAPERFLSKPADVRSDLYSVGIVMYEIFTGTIPFRNERDDIVATMFSHVHDVPAPPREINRKIPENLERVIMRAIEREPAQRYQTAAAFIADVKKLLSPLETVPAEALTPRSVTMRDQTTNDPSLRAALERALAPTRNRTDALELVLRGMMATRHRSYDDAKDAYLSALNDLEHPGNDVEYAKTVLKYGLMLLQKASDGIRDPQELRDGVERLRDCLRIFHEYGLHDQYGEAEYVINALERTAIGLY